MPLAARFAVTAALAVSVSPQASAQPRAPRSLAGPVLESVSIQGPVRLGGVRASLDAASGSVRACPWRPGGVATVQMRVGDDGRVGAARITGSAGIAPATAACLVARHRAMRFPTARGVGETTLEVRWAFHPRDATVPNSQGNAPVVEAPTRPARAVLTGSVAIRSVTSDQRGSVASLGAEMHRREAEFRDCYEARLDQRPRFEGTLVLELTFTPGERVHRAARVARLGGSLPDDAVATCVTTLLRRAVFAVAPETRNAQIALAFSIERPTR